MHFFKWSYDTDRTLIGKLYGITYQIYQNLLDSFLISEQLAVFMEVNSWEKLDIPRLSLKITHLKCLSHYIMKWKPTVHNVKLTKLDFREVQYVFYKTHQEKDTAPL